MSELSDIIRRHQNIVFFGGAGVSTESGIPDFRSSTGLFTTRQGGKYPPENLLSHTCFREDPEAFYEFYRSVMIYTAAKPNAAHLALAQLEAAGRLTAVITQNIDGLHQQAGSLNVIELHGSVHRNYCQRCHAAYGLDFIVASIGVPRCPACGGVVRPDIVLYEERLDDDVVAAAIDHIGTAEVLIVGGTSLNVYPAAGLVQYYHGDHLVLINKTATGYDKSANLVIHDSLGRVLAEACAQGL